MMADPAPDPSPAAQVAQDVAAEPLSGPASPSPEPVQSQPLAPPVGTNTAEDGQAAPVANAAQSKIGQLQKAGFNQQEISDWTTKTGGRLLAAGFNQQEVNNYLGIKYPDTAPVQTMVQNNLSSSPNQQESPDKEPPSFSANLDKGMGIPASKILAGADIGQETLSPEMRAHLMDCYSKGTSNNFADFMQCVIPAAAKAVEPEQKPSMEMVAVQSLLRGALQGSREVGQVASPFKDRPADISPKDYTGNLIKQNWSEGYKNPDWYVAHLIGGLAQSYPTIAMGTAGTIAGTFAGGALFPGGGEIPGGIVGGMGGFGAGGAMQTIAQSYQSARAEGLSHDASVNRALAETATSGAFSSLMGLAPELKAFGTTPQEIEGKIVQVVKKPVSEALLQIFGVQPAIGAANQATNAKIEGKKLSADDLLTGYVTNAGTGLGIVGAHASLHIIVHPRVAEAVAPSVGKDPSAVTPEDVHQNIARSAETSNVPSANTFLDHGLSMTGTPEGEQKTAETLRTVYSETGVPPSQVMQDAQNNPQIAADIESGKIPEAYNHLRDQEGRPVPPPGVHYTDLDPNSMEFAVHKAIAKEAGVDLQPYPKEEANAGEQAQIEENKVGAREKDEVPQTQQGANNIKPLIQHAPEVSEFSEHAKSYPQTLEGMSQAAKDFVVKKGQETGNENLITLDGNGSALSHSEGEKEKVFIPKDVVKSLNDSDNSVTLIHSHPLPLGLGPEDINSLSRPGVSSIVAMGPEGHSSEASLSDGMKEKLKEKTIPQRKKILSDLANGAFESAKLAVEDNARGGSSKFDSEQELMDFRQVHNYVFNKALEEAGITNYNYTDSHFDIVPEDVTQKAIDETVQTIKEGMKLHGIETTEERGVDRGAASADRVGSEEISANVTEPSATSGVAGRTERELGERNSDAPERTTLSPEHQALEDNLGVPEDMNKSQLGKLNKKIEGIFSNKDQTDLPKASDLTEGQFDALEEYGRRVEDAQSALPMQIKQETIYSSYTPDEVDALRNEDPEGFDAYAAARRSMKQLYSGEKPDMDISKAQKILSEGRDKYEAAFSNDKPDNTVLPEGPIETHQDAVQNIRAASKLSTGIIDNTHQMVQNFLSDFFHSIGEKIVPLIPESAKEKAQNVKREILNAVVPMETGSIRARAAAKIFANRARWLQWNGSRLFDYLTKNFSKEELSNMWNAMDEASVYVQTLEANGMDRDAAMEDAREKGIGHFALPFEQQRIITELSKWAQESWGAAKKLGMVEGEGLPFWTPRMAAVVGDDGKWGSPGMTGEGRPEINPVGRNLKTSSQNLKERGYLTAEETERAMKGLFGEEHDESNVELVRDIRTMPLAIARLQQAIAGRSLISEIKQMSNDLGGNTVTSAPEEGYFTIPGHPAFQTYRPKLEMDETGKWQQVKDANGNPQFEKAPIYVSKEFEGPLNAVLSQKSGEIYKGLMALKGKAMSMIMYSPLIHNAVEWGRALPAMPGKVLTFKAYFEGNAARKDPVQMKQAIDSGMVPIGSRFFNQDISSIMEEPSLTPGRSWTAKLLGGLAGKVNETTGENVKTAIDNLGNFWHNTLLWDRVADLQMGLYTNMRDQAIKSGMDPIAAQTKAAHLANRFSGALPMESMSNSARKLANVGMFSRSFTVGNLGVMKDMLVGLPSDVKSQLEQSIGKEGADQASRATQRKAIAAFALDIGLMYVGNSILQDTLDKLKRDKSLGQIEQGYVNRWHNLMQDHQDSPWDLLDLPADMQALSSTSENEPGKENRIHFSDDPKTGTAYYMRMPTGKIGEEFLGWLTSPLDMMRRKSSTIVAPLVDVYKNEDYFGHPIYDKNARGLPGAAENLGKVVGHFMRAQIPEDSIVATYKALTGAPGADINTMKVAGPLAGITFSKGYPGGPEAGLIAAVQKRQQEQVSSSLPAVKEAVLNNDEDKARQILTDLGLRNSEQNRIIKHYQDPGSKVNDRSLETFAKTATPEEKRLMASYREDTGEDTNQ